MRHAARPLLLLLAVVAAIDQPQPPPPQIRKTTATTQELLRWRRQLAQVRAMRSRDVHEISKLIRTRKTRGDAEPSFSRLFTHATWREWASTPPIWRWWKILLTWHRSTVFHAVWPPTLFIGVWALVVGLIDMHFPLLITKIFGAMRPISALPAELQGTAIGLLIVFRTNNGYDRLAEARAALGRALSLSREMAQSVACTWPLTPIYEEPQYDTYVGDGQKKTLHLHKSPFGTSSSAQGHFFKGYSLAGSIGGDVGHLHGEFPGAVGGLPSTAALDAARYLVAFAWSLKAILREPAMEHLEEGMLKSPEDVLRVLLPPAEVHALLGVGLTGIPVALLGRLRMLFATEQRAGRLQSHVHLKLEEDLRDLNLILADNQRLFHSPIPPTMSRHVTRCLLLWLSMLPFALCGRLPPLGNAIACAITAYIFTGMEEIGAQVEQPFESMPLWQLCHIMAHDAEACIAGDAPGHVEGIF